MFFNMIDSAWVTKRSLQAYGLLPLGRIFQHESEVPPKATEAGSSRKSSDSSHYASINKEKEQNPEAWSAGGSGKSPDMGTEHTKDLKRDHPTTGPAHHQPQTEEVEESCKDVPLPVVEKDFKIKLISKKDGHRAPPAAPWLTDEELWFMDWAFRDTVKELLAEGIAFDLSRFQGTPNFPPLLLDRGYGVALCIRRLKAARDIGPLSFNSINDEAFKKKLHSLAYDVTTASFRHKDLIWSIRITTFFAQISPANAPVWWRPGAEMDKEECEFTSTLSGFEVPQTSMTNKLVLSVEEATLSQRNPNSSTSIQGRAALVGKENKHDNVATNRKPRSAG